MHQSIAIKEYKDIDIEETLPLYNRVGWSNYTNNSTMLESAYRNSLMILSAYCEDKLAGIIRLVGDGFSIVYIQDLIVLPEYQRMGIGKKLLNEVDILYPHVYQKVLLTDNSPGSIAFYESCGFISSEKYDCLTFVKYFS